MEMAPTPAVLQGRVLVFNNLVASALWHRLIMLQAPRELVLDIQRTLVDLLWSGQHWIQAAVLYLPVDKGEKGLAAISMKNYSFSFKCSTESLVTGRSPLDYSNSSSVKEGRWYGSG